MTSVSMARATVRVLRVPAKSGENPALSRNCEALARRGG
jgi:hypothetical protein